MGVINQKHTNEYSIYEGDCIQVMADLKDESIDLSVYSPPFAVGSGGLYIYSSSERDLSNSDNYDDFFRHYKYALKQLFRVTKPGRCTAVHCMDTPSSNSGQDYLIDFPGDIIRAHEKEGFNYIARHCIWKEPLTVRNRTMTKNLAHATIVKDSIYCGVASADYLLIFRKKGENKIPITHKRGLTRYYGERKIPSSLLKYKNWKGKQTENRFSHWIWRQYASSFWDDIRLDNVLKFKEGKDEDDEKHIHPLQLDVIARIVELRSNPGEIILSPFMGVGSEVYGSVTNNRKAIGIELKPSYYKQTIKNLKGIKKEQIKRLF
jgi:DNA modification methylase|tara:strand:- start:180 stop:1139 length:960 start_codon:yes stop_codon:yes gene_type:complete